MSLLCRRSLRVSTLFTRHSTFFPIFTRTFFRFANLSTNVAVLPLRAGGKKGGKRGGDEDDGPTVVEIDYTELGKKMDKTIENLIVSFSSLRIERLSPSLVENILVEIPEKSDNKQAADAKNPKKKKMRTIPIKNLADISILDHRSLVIHAHDPELVKAIIKALTVAEGGFAPQMGDGNSIKLPIPKMTVEYREQLEKTVSKQAEDAKEQLRKTRRDALDSVKSMKKGVGKDDIFRHEKQIQDLLDKKTKVLMDRTAQKIKEIKELE